MFKEEYKKLLGLIEESQEGQGVNLEEILEESVRFFEELRKSYPSAPKEQREEMLKMMGTLHARLQEISKKVSESAGMSEEEFLAYSENPSHFTPEQWQLVQETRKRLYDSARKFTQALETKSKTQALPSQGAKITRPIRAPTRRSRRGDWMKS